MTSDELVSQDLSCRVPRQRLGADLPRRRHLVGRQSAATPRGEGSLIDHARAVQHHERALTACPVTGSSTPATHASTTASCSSRRFSTSEGNTFSDDTKITSRARELMYSRPFSMRPTSPLF